ncbi:unnamed protein product, partial [Nesidiocoris tenuis]
MAFSIRPVGVICRLFNVPAIDKQLSDPVRRSRINKPARMAFFSREWRRNKTGADMAPYASFGGVSRRQSTLAISQKDSTTTTMFIDGLSRPSNFSACL